MLALALAGALSACTPSGFVARQLARAPNTFPQAVAPEPRVYYTFPGEFTERVPLQWATVGEPPVTLAYRVLPPADYGLQVVVTNHASPSGLRPFYRILATVPGDPLPSSSRPRGTVVLLHGYGLSQDSMIPWALQLGSAGWRCVLVDLRGHGESNGRRIYFGIREAADLRELLDELKRRDQVTAPIAVLGVSYGAAVAIRWTLMDGRVALTIAMTPYGRLGDAVEALREDYASWLPRGIIRRATARLPALAEAGPDGLDPADWLRGSGLTPLFIAADGDVVAPTAVVQGLRELSAPGSAMVELRGASHEEAPFRLDALSGPVLQWLESAPHRVGIPHDQLREEGSGP